MRENRRERTPRTCRCTCGADETCRRPATLGCDGCLKGLCEACVCRASTVMGPFGLCDACARRIKERLGDAFGVIDMAGHGVEAAPQASAMTTQRRGDDSWGHAEERPPADRSNDPAFVRKGDIAQAGNSATGPGGRGRKGHVRRSTAPVRRLWKENPRPHRDRRPVS